MLVQPGNLIIEFDGRAKYERCPALGESRLADGDLVWAEKQREDRLRELGFEVIRLVWPDLSDPRRVLAIRRLQAAAERGRSRGASCGRYVLTS
jgi:hypothetical protein